MKDLQRLQKKKVFQNLLPNSEQSERLDVYKRQVLGKLPIDPKLTQACDAGLIEDVENIYLDGVMDIIL